MHTAGPTAGQRHANPCRSVFPSYPPRPRRSRRRLMDGHLPVWAASDGRSTRAQRIRSPLLCSNMLPAARTRSPVAARLAAPAPPHPSAARLGRRPASRPGNLLAVFEVICFVRPNSKASSYVATGSGRPAPAPDPENWLIAGTRAALTRTFSPTVSRACAGMRAATTSSIKPKEESASSLSEPPLIGAPFRQRLQEARLPRRCLHHEPNATKPTVMCTGRDDGRLSWRSSRDAPRRTIDTGDRLVLHLPVEDIGQALASTTA